MTVGFKAMFYSIYLFIFLDGLHHLDVAFVSCLQIFLGTLGPDTSYFRNWKGRGKNDWDVMALCFNFLGLRFSSVFFFFFPLHFLTTSKRQAGPMGGGSGHAFSLYFSVCCLWPAGCLLVLPNCCPGNHHFPIHPVVTPLSFLTCPALVEVNRVVPKENNPMLLFCFSSEPNVSMVVSVGSRGI